MRLDYKKTIYVGLAFFLITMFWQVYDNTISEVLITNFGLNQFWSGVVMAIDNILAVFLLPLFGLLSDKTKTKYGRRTPYIFLGTIFSVVLLISLSFIIDSQTSNLKNKDPEIIELYNEYQVWSNDNKGKAVSVSDWKKLYNDNIANYKDKLKHDSNIKRYNDLIGNKDEEFSFEGIFSGYTKDSDVIEKGDAVYLNDLYYNYLSIRASEVTLSNSNNFILFIVLLFILLFAMAAFRSPAVALMPDVTLKPLRSKANAVINLLGSVGGIISVIVLLTLGLDKESYISYTLGYIIVGVLMLIALALFLFKVRENKLVEEYEEEVVKYNLEENETTDDKKKMLSKGEIISLLLILSSVFFWYMGYNAVISKLRDYAPKMLGGMSVGTPLIVAQGAAILTFIPIGILSSKFGRKKMILVGVLLLALCFVFASTLNANTGGLLYIVLAFTGIAWATINVNSFPMVVELAKGSHVGKYTGYYYAFSMAAQIITPMLSGLLMDDWGRKWLFPYAAFFVGVSFVTMLFVKHGDAKAEKKDSLLEYFDED